MATRVVPHSDARFEKFFFPGVAVLILITVFLGFARTYYLAGVCSKPTHYLRSFTFTAHRRLGLLSSVWRV